MWPFRRKEAVETRATGSGYTAEIMAAREAYISGRQGIGELLGDVDVGDRLPGEPQRRALLLADLLDRPVVVDSTAGLVALGAPRGDRRQALRELTAPDFSLPHLDGGVTSLSDHRSKKRLLIAFSSW